MIDSVVAFTSHTRVRRRLATDGCRMRVHTMPEALATSIAATRSRSCSCSSSWISCGSGIPCTAFRVLPDQQGGLPAGPGQGFENLTGVLAAQCATLQVQAPASD